MMLAFLFFLAPSIIGYDIVIPDDPWTGSFVTLIFGLGFGFVLLLVLQPNRPRRSGSSYITSVAAMVLITGLLCNGLINVVGFLDHDERSLDMLREHKTTAERDAQARNGTNCDQDAECGRLQAILLIVDGLVQYRKWIIALVLLILLHIVGGVFELFRIIKGVSAANTHAEALRSKQREAVTAAFSPRPDTGSNAEDSKDIGSGETPGPPWHQRAWQTVCAFVATWLGEEGAFVYPPTVIIAAIVTVLIQVMFLAGVRILAHVCAGYISLLQHEAVDAQAGLANAETLLKTVEVLCREDGGFRTEYAAQICRIEYRGAVGAVSTAKSLLGRLDGTIANLPAALSTGMQWASALCFIGVLWVILQNVGGIKAWCIRTTAGEIIPGYNVTTQRRKLDAARSAEYIAIFISCHFLSCFTASFTFAVVFTILGWSTAWAWIEGQLSAILAFLVFYCIMYYFLREYVGNRLLTDHGQAARKPRAMTNFIACLCMWYIITGLMAALIRLVIYLPITFMRFCRLDITLVPPEWQRWDLAFRSCHALLAHHTRTTNPIQFSFCELLFDAQHDARRHLLNQTEPGAHEPPSTPTTDASRRARTRWLLAKTLISNPSLCPRAKHLHKGHSTDRATAEIAEDAFAGLFWE
jgi:hypothetical protein